MERYKLTLEHEFIDNEDIKDIEEPIICTVDINDLNDSMSFNKHVLYEMCESILKYLDLEKDGELND